MSSHTLDRITAPAASFDLDRLGVPAASQPLAEGTFVIAPSSPNVYLITGGHRRWVPDPATLLALAPNGWSAVVSTSDAVLGAVPEGPALPSRADGKVYIGAGAPEVYVVQSLTRHHIPDPDTLTALYGGWGAVATVDPADLAAIPLGAPIPSVDAGSPITTGDPIDAYLRSLPDMVVDQVPERHDAVGTATQDVDGIAYSVSSEHATISNQTTMPWALSPVLDVLYPGALLRGDSLFGGQLAPLAGGLTRSGGTITVATDLKVPGSPVRSSSVHVDHVSQPTIQDARQQLLRDLNPSDGSVYADWEMHQARTTEHGLVKLGVSVHAGSFSGDLKSSLDTNVEQTTVMAMFRQVFYSVTFTPDDSPNSFFAPTVSLDQVQAVSGPNDPPVYLAQVDYGRLLIVSLTGTAELKDLNLALEASVNAASTTAPGGKVDVTIEHQQTIQDSELRVMLVGGNGGTNMPVLTDPLNHLAEYINTGGNPTVDNPGAPLRYVARHTGSRKDVAIGLSTDYTEAVAAVGQNVNGATYHVWDGPGGGPFSTGVRVANGDQLTVNASGTNWSGVLWTGTYGPDGWTTWAKPGGSGYPLPNNHPFALAGAWDGSAVDGPWFYIGSGLSETVSHGADRDGDRAPSSRVLFLGTNDNNPLNGDAKYKFTVQVSVRRRVLANVQRAVI